MRSVVEVCRSPGERVASIVQQAATQAIERRGAFTIAIAGGSLVKMLGAMVDLPGVQWDKWHVAWVDERCLPHADKESNYGCAREAWLDKVPIPASQVHAINEKLCPGGGGAAVADAAALDYEARLKAIPEAVLPRGAGGLPAFDLLLLGFGPDGHICSLFPGHALLGDSSDRWVLPVWDSPKPPPERITLSMQAVNCAARVVLVGTGEGKKDVVKAAFLPGCDLPCARAFGASPETVRPTWVLDQPAASSLVAEELAGVELVHFDDSRPTWVLDQPAASSLVAEELAGVELVHFDRLQAHVGVGPAR
eukprot:CAMPEP_0171201322 /NCGR_PEP_ID=MMETSP0790-20130122/24431_1 /TAXON_ID=2925 /ORGANISM="Alexandrium catenella, Strain OF101" /LENGTH=307 /DNA_ID=CAMNT_0011666719 /DNA_START=6 /DNA_END=926 /DNA_ORIENTATION=-